MKTYEEIVEALRDCEPQVFYVEDIASLILEEREMTFNHVIQILAAEGHYQAAGFVAGGIEGEGSS